MKTVELPVTGGHTTLVDEDIAKELVGKKLFLISSHRYVGFSGKAKNVYLHRFVMGFPKGKTVDHKFGDIFDNRRDSLRITTHSQNMANLHTKPRSRTGYRLVYFKKRKCSRVRIQFGKRPCLSLGNYSSRHIAAIFADEFLLDTVGSFAMLNFHDDIKFSELADFIEKTSGHIFKVVFSRRSDGKQREMLCRTGVHKSQKGKSLAFDPSERCLFSVYDISKKMYRFIPLDRVICLRYRKTNYRVIYNPTTPPKAA